LTDLVEVCVTASFTAELIEEALGFWMRELGIAAKIRFAPYNQVFQQLLDAGSLVRSNRHGVNVVLVRFADWGSSFEDVRQFFDLLETAARSSGAPFVVAICPGAGPARLLEELAVSRQRSSGTFELILPDGLAELYPVAEVHDPHGEELGRVPYTPEFFAALATLVARKIHSLRAAPFKAVVLDCDDTLWQGICGEDGPEGVRIDPPHWALQEFMVAQRAAGVLLCLVSKNNPADVEEVFRAHPEMPLGLVHFIATRIDWEPKPKNLAAIADELGLGLEDFIFVDDSAKECSEVQAECPEVLALTLPSRASRIPDFLRHVWAFDRLRVTEEDRLRNELYSQRMERARAERRASSLEEFVASLRLEVRIEPMTPGQLPRVAQLTQRTNQMNTSGNRRSEGEIREMLEAGRAECLTVHVTDRFGSYGLAGVILFSASAEALVIDTLLLSCRALGRGVEHRMLAAAGEVACQRGIPMVEVRFQRTPRNQPALLFLEGAGGVRMTAAQAAAVRYRPSNAPIQEKVQVESGGRREAIDYERIATALRTPEQVIERLRAGKRVRPVSAGHGVPPRTELEKRLAAIWADALGLASIGVDDNFFDLGGHSLLAVELLSRVRRELGAELTLEVVYSGDFTVAELARAIEMKEIEQADGQGYAALIEEIENLSDEEVRRLLAEEGGETP
jgi:FkbH-like protein